MQWKMAAKKWVIGIVVPEMTRRSLQNGLVEGIHKGVEKPARETLDCSKYR